MGLLSILILILFIISAIILILVVLIQDDQGEGIGGLFGGGSTAFGSRSGNVLTRFTSIVGAIFLVGAFGLAWLNRTPQSSDVIRKARLERLREAEQEDWWVERIDPSSTEISPDAPSTDVPATDASSIDSSSTDAPAPASPDGEESQSKNSGLLQAGETPDPGSSSEKTSPESNP